MPNSTAPESKALHPEVLLRTSTAVVELMAHVAPGSDVEAFWAANCLARDADPRFLAHLVNASAGAAKFYALLIREDGKPKALLVGRRAQERYPIKLAYFKFAEPRLCTLLISYGGWLGEITEARAALFVDAFRQLLARGEANAVALLYPEAESTIALQALGRPAFVCRDHLVVRAPHYFSDLPGDGVPFLQSLSSNEREKHRQRRRRLTGKFRAVQIQAFHAPQHVSTLMSLSEQIAKTSYQRSIDVGFADNAHIRSRMEFAAREGWMRGFVLFLDETPCAFWIGTLRNGVFNSDYLAFDPTYSKYGPGTYLMFEAIPALAGDPLCAARRIDWGIGMAEYKRRYANRSVEEALILIYAPSLRALTTNLLRSALGRLDRYIQGLLGATMKPAIRSLLLSRRRNR